MAKPKDLPELIKVLKARAGRGLRRYAEQAVAQYAAVQIVESTKNEKHHHQKVKRSTQTVLKTCDDKELSARAKKIIKEIKGIQ